MRNIAVTMECFIRKGNKYLMLHRAPHKRIMPDVWMAPGGHREINEGLFEATKREVLEETGLAIKNLQIKAVGNALLKDLKQELYFHMITADYESGTLIQSQHDGEFVWLTEQEIKKLNNLLAELEPVIGYILNPKAPIVSYKAVYMQGNELESFEIEKT